MSNRALRLVEHYVSTQGEGPHVGRLTQFIRFAGCNLKCALWPCDSQFAIDPKLYREEMVSKYDNELVADIKQFVTLTGAKNLCFTGGEPFLQNHETLLKVMRTMKGEDVGWEAFTNGTFEIPEDFFALGLEPVMDWKLPGSGEPTWLAQRSRNLRSMDSHLKGVVKFTVADENDFVVAFQVWESLIIDTNVPVFVGPVWSDTWTATNVVDLMQRFKVPWRLNVQVHNFIYGAQTRGT